ncbi:trafficking protein particle complex II-specific subunit 130-like protein isoform X3 [Gossypium australe]|uniref:Trafficking protein particle complex II-specific subunit 130-like protein isoform X3 n=1 Tax=Gossypium australe TaxID=47621 RepID=A0A5B6VU53_9ROSI|nr:trafficking protein particle complex II-specific subunit 130-like protein isoform X3 [Gossypium australe]
MLGLTFTMDLHMLDKVMEDPISAFFPLVISPTSRAGLLFCLCLEKRTAEGFYFFESCLFKLNSSTSICYTLSEKLYPLTLPHDKQSISCFTDENKVPPENILNIRYEIAGDRTIGAHPPATMKSNENDEDANKNLVFRSALVLQQPVLSSCLAVGVLPLPSDGI